MVGEKIKEKLETDQDDNTIDYFGNVNSAENRHVSVCASSFLYCTNNKIISTQFININETHRIT